MSDNAETAILAGGCFWGMQELLRHRDGVVSTRVGYTGGENDNPTDATHPGHAQALVPRRAPAGSRRGRCDPLRSGWDLLPRHPRRLLPDPRPNDQGPSGARPRFGL